MTCSKCGQLSMFELSISDDDSTFLCEECRPKPVEKLDEKNVCTECGGYGFVECDMGHEHPCEECE